MAMQLFLLNGILTLKVFFTRTFKVRESVVPPEFINFHLFGLEKYFSHCQHPTKFKILSFHPFPSYKSYGLCLLSWPWHTVTRATCIVPHLYRWLFLSVYLMSLCVLHNISIISEARRVLVLVSAISRDQKPNNKSMKTQNW